MCTIADAFYASSADDSPRTAVREFHRACRTLISHLLKFNDAEAGMFGKTLVFLAKVEHRTGNTLALRVLLWTDNVGRTTTVGCGARAVYNRLYNYEEFNRKAETEDTPECIAADGAAQLFNWRPEGLSERAGGKGARGVSPCSSRTILCRNRTCHYIHQLSERC